MPIFAPTIVEKLHPRKLRIALAKRYPYPDSARALLKGMGYEPVPLSASVSPDAVLIPGTSYPAPSGVDGAVPVYVDDPAVGASVIRALKPLTERHYLENPMATATKSKSSSKDKSSEPKTRGVGQAYFDLFAQNCKASKAKRLTDEQIVALITEEFPGQTPWYYNDPAAVQMERRMYNKGQLTGQHGELPSKESVPFDENGGEMEVKRGRKPGEANPKAKAKVKGKVKGSGFTLTLDGQVKPKVKKRVRKPRETSEI